MKNTNLLADAIVTLGATIFNATSVERLKDCWVWFYWCAENGTCGTVGHDLTDANGVASVPWTYPDDGGVYAFWARIHNAQQIVSSPVMPTVGEETKLTMNVEQDEGFNYTVSGWLLCDGAPVAHEPIEVKVNETSTSYVETSQDGGYSFWIKLQPAENKPTNYQIELIYQGSNALNLTLYDVLPDGEQYAVCTTLQCFGYKPAANSTWLTVEPQATQMMTATKTPEEMQTEAEQSGWLRIEHEFSWWPPWYRLHIKITIDNLTIDIGFNPLLPGGETWTWQGLELFQAITEEIIEEIMWDIAGIFTAYITAKTLGITVLAGLIAESLKFSGQLIMLVLFTEGPELLASAIASFIMGIIAIKVDIALELLKALADILSRAALNVLNTLADILSDAIATTQVIFRNWVDYLEILFDFLTGAFALAKYFGWM